MTGVSQERSEPGAGVAVVVVSFDTRDVLARCLEAVVPSGHEVVVVDNGSRDGSPVLVRERFPGVRLVEAPNRGYGAGLNAGAEVAAGSWLLFLNADAWPVADGIERLVAFAARDPAIGLAGPRLASEDGTLQRSVRGFPTLWRLATEYLFLRKLAPGSRALNAFYAGGFAHDRAVEAEFLMGAVLLVRRAAFEEVGGFDEDFFMFSEEVDLCYRLRAAGWKVVFAPEAEFVHLGGSATRLDWGAMFREQLRGHLRFLAKHRGTAEAERARRLLLASMRLRGALFRGGRGVTYRQAAAWLASGDAGALLQSSG
jgi:GT2 family glycosyltransferase